MGIHAISGEGVSLNNAKVNLSAVERLNALAPDAPAELTQVQKFLYILRERAKKDMYFFGKAILGYKDLVPHIHGKLCRLLQDLTQKRKRVKLPRGWFKSTCVSIIFPLWLAINNPNIRVLLTQSTLQNASKRLSSIDAHFKSNSIFRAVFHDLLPDKDCRWNNSIMTVKRPGVFDEGTFEAAGTRTKKVSNHYDVIIEDDTVTPDLDDMTAQNVTPSPEDIEQAIGYHAQVIPLFANPSEGINIVVGTPWAQRDLLSWIEENQPEYQSFEIPDVDAEGNPNFPERFSLETLGKIKAAMGPYLYACNYQLRPMRSEDMIFKPEWFEKSWYETEPRGLMVYMTADLAGDPEQNRSGKSDYNALIVCGKDQQTGLVYVLDTWRKKCNPGEVIDQMFIMNDLWHPLITGPEIVAYQNTFIYHLKERMKSTGKFFRVEPIRQGHMSKSAKIMGLQPVVACNALLFRKSQRELVAELEAFPLGANDDLADALAMQLQFWRVTSGERAHRPPGDTVYRFEDAYDELMKKEKTKFALEGSGISGWGRN